VKRSQGFSGIVMGGVAAIALVQPAFASPSAITRVSVNPTGSGMNLVLQTPTGDKPQVFAVNRGNSWTADITNTRMNLTGGDTSFVQENPAPGIALVRVAPLDSNSVRVTVVGQAGTPVGQISRPAQGGIVFALNPGVAVSSSAPSASAASPAPAPSASGNATFGNLAQVPSGSTPMVPNPEVTYQGGAPIPNPNVPPNLPRAMAPPVGDMAVSMTDASAAYINLGTSERVPRLVLRDAPAREVLSLLARAAGLNLAFTNETQKEGQQPQAGAAGALDEGPKVTLDIENEPIQNVFNYVLQISGLDANRVGRTVFVGKQLPNAARNVVVRSIRLNQTNVTSAVNFLVTLGAESAVSRERLVTSVNAVPVGQLAGGGGGTALTQTQTTTEARIETQRVNYSDSTPLLRGLQVSGDERTNQVTLVGTPKQIELATTQLTQLDVRRRQVTVNVRVVDINLLAGDRASASFSFGIDQTRFVNQGGVAVVNFGSRSPAVTGLGADPNAIQGPSTRAGGVLGAANAFDFARNFFGQLQASVTNGNAKILTDPTLLVQEGQTATVNLTQEVVTNLTQQITSSGGTTTATLTVEKSRAGLILPVKVDRIDDNGFISLSVAPAVTRPDTTVTVNFPGIPPNGITLLAERRLESGQVRLRDGQTLILAGIIQDQDRAEVTKFPILGDLPLLGALFRRTNRSNERKEVIVLVTPRILDDSDRSTLGYGYNPSPAAQQVIERGTVRP
jgi:type IV pilus assembly protein PilQ